IKRLLGITLALAALAFASSAQAQTQLTTTVQLTSTVLGLTASGTGGLTIAPTLDPTGVVTGGSVQFQFNVSGFPVGTIITGLSLQCGSLVVNTNINPVLVTAAGTAALVVTANTVSAAIIQTLLSNPSCFLVNVATAANTTGALSGPVGPLAVTALTGGGCQTICFRSPTFFSTFGFGGCPLIIIPGENGNAPVSACAPFKFLTIFFFLKPLNTLAIPTNPFDRFARAFIAFQLSLQPQFGFGKAAEAGVLNSNLACQGVTIAP